MLLTAKQGVEIAVVMKSSKFWSECSCAIRFFSQSSKPNELIFNTMFYDSLCLEGPHGQLSWILVSECDDFEYCDVTSMTL